MKQIIQTRREFLGAGWFANEYSDGSMSFESDKGEQLSIPVESVSTLRRIVKEAGYLPGNLRQA